jgi:Cft2 family RNA processing exonuclease
MVEGGRVLHHLIAYGSDPRNAVVLTGFQAGGTRGAALLQGERVLRIFGRDVPIRASVPCSKACLHAGNRIRPKRTFKSSADSTGFGRLGASINGRPEIFPLYFHVDKRSVVFRTADGTKLRELIDTARLKRQHRRRCVCRIAFRSWSRP